MTDKNTVWSWNPFPAIQNMVRHRLRISYVIVTWLLLLSALAHAGIWQKLTNPAPDFVSDPILLTDGTVMFQQVHSNGLGTGIWWKLTPEISGAYIGGTWTQLPTMPNGYAPDFFASAVLPDGRVIVEGGEYNGNSTTQMETTMGAIYDPFTNAWTAVGPPPGWSTIGDAPSVVLPNGTFMLGNCCTSQWALLDAASLTWTTIDNGSKADSNNEEGWTLLPNGKVLTVDISDIGNTELYNPATETWSSTGILPVPLVHNCEIGPAVLRPDGTVVALGANSNTDIYNSSTGAWTKGPSLPSTFSAEDAPSALEPSGSVLVGLGSFTSSCTSSPSQSTEFYEFNGSSFAFVGGPVADYPFESRLLVLPSGRILWTHDSTDVEVYTPSSTTFPIAWQPTITSVSTTLVPGSKNNLIVGTQFNGLSQASMFGDDYQAATNYPLVYIINTASGNKFYCRTHNHSTMAVATGSGSVSTEFDVPSNIETGSGTLAVVVNGITSAAVVVTVK